MAVGSISLLFKTLVPLAVSWTTIKLSIKREWFYSLISKITQQPNKKKLILKLLGDLTNWRVVFTVTQLERHLLAANHLRFLIKNPFFPPRSFIFLQYSSIKKCGRQAFSQKYALEHFGVRPRKIKLFVSISLERENLWVGNL